MKQDVQELGAVAEVVAQVEGLPVELLELQLALIGGGVGEVVIA